jgi:hypothetical protein
MTERQRWTSLVLSLVLGLGGAVYTNVLYTDRVDRRRAEAEQRAAQERAAQSEQNRQVICRIALGQADAFSDATSKIGKDARQAWLDLAAQLRC